MTSLHRTPGVRGLIVGMRLAPKKASPLETFLKDLPWERVSLKSYNLTKDTGVRMYTRVSDA